MTIYDTLTMRPDGTLRTGDLVGEWIQNSGEKNNPSIALNPPEEVQSSDWREPKMPLISTETTRVSSKINVERWTRTSGGA